MQRSNSLEARPSLEANRDSTEIYKVTWSHRKLVPNLASVNGESDIRIVKLVLVAALFIALRPPYHHTQAQINNSVQPTPTQETVKVEHKPQEPKAPAPATKQVEQPAPKPETKPKPQPKKPVQPMSNRAIGQQMAAAKGWTGNQWSCLEKLWTGESQWSHTAHNKSSGAHGIPQSLPGSKMATHGADWKTNPRTQIAWGLDYISRAHGGTPCSNLAFWNAQSPHWY